MDDDIDREYNYEYDYEYDFRNDMEHIKQTLICLAVGCYVNVALSICILM